MKLLKMIAYLVTAAVVILQQKEMMDLEVAVVLQEFQ
jgi:hypothetical protein